MYEDLTRNLENVIKKESAKQFHSTGELRIDWMAQECLTAITDLTSKLAEVTEHRDAAVKDVRELIHNGRTSECHYCTSHKTFVGCTECSCCAGTGSRTSNWQWRGKKEDTDHVEGK